MRITGGTLTGRNLRTADVPGLRPTKDMVRQSVFGMLAASLPGTRVLDLFAGSGAAGLEAWSRGAEHVTWVERDRDIHRVLSANVAALAGSDPGLRVLREEEVRRAAAEHLALGMRNGRLSIRGVVRQTVELFDLLYLYPDYEVTALLDELRQQMR